MPRAAMLAALCASACFTKPPFNGGGDDDNGDGGTGDGNRGDGRVSDAPGLDAAPCTTEPSDDFSNTSVAPCAPWGYEMGNPTYVSRAMGGLQMGPSPNQAWAVGCITNEFDVRNGTSIRLATAQTGQATVQRFAWKPMGDFVSTGIRIANTSGGTKLYFDSKDGVAVPNAPSYDPATMKWLRLIPSGTSLVAQYSADGNTWMPIGTDDYAPMTPGLGTVEITAGGMYGSTDFVLWDDFNVLTCPP